MEITVHLINDAPSGFPWATFFSVALPVFLTGVGIFLVSYNERMKTRTAQLESERAKGIERLHKQMVKVHQLLIDYVDLNDAVLQADTIIGEIRALFIVFDETQIYFPKRFAVKTRELLSHFRDYTRAAIAKREGPMFSELANEEFKCSKERLADGLREVQEEFRRTLGINDYEKGRFSEWWKKFFEDQFSQAG